MTIFPDHISAGDPIFNNSQIYSKTNERFIYSLGYYTDSQNKIFSEKYGIYFEPVYCGNSLTYKNNDDTTFFGSNIIGDQFSTTHKGMNFFEEIELFKNVITGKNFECPSNIKVIHDIHLRLTYLY